LSMKGFMMKVSVSLFVLAFVCISALKAQSKPESRVVKEYNKIYISGYFNVELVKSDKEFVKLEFNGVESNKIITKVKRGELILKHKYPFSKNYSVKAVIGYKNISELTAEYNSDITFGKDTLTFDKLEITAGGNSNVNIAATVRDFEVVITDGATINLTGSSKYLDLNVATGAIYKGFGFVTELATISVSTNAKAHLKVTDKIEGSVSTNGHMNFIGEPKTVKIRTILGGSYVQLDEDDLDEEYYF